MNGRRLARPGAILLGLLAGVAVLAADGPRPISPGDQATPVGVNTTCPTFSWSGDDRATGYDLAIYRLEGDGALDPSTPMRIAGDARTWTPSVDRCPESGKEYAWAVRALTDGGPGPWSELLLFATPGAPTEDEVRRALALLRQYGREGDVGEGLAPSRGSGREPLPPRQAREDARSSPTPPHPGRAQDPPLLSSSIGADTPAPQAVTPPSTFSLNLSGDVDLGGFVFKNGNSFIHNSGDNTAVGTLALANVQPNFFTQKGLWNSAFGSRALVANTEGVSNTAVGRRALYSNVEGGDNTAIGDKALYKNLTNRNTALGSYALYENVSGFHNTAVGRLALHNTTGSVNTAIGSSAGINWTTGESNIAIGHGAYGLAGESGTIRIGGQGNQSRTFIGGIFGETPQYASVEMFIDGNGQLGAPVSSARFKQDIHSLEGVSDRLLDLRPVSFRYKDHDDQDGADAGERPLEYGLIAEEVAKVFPELVINDADGNPFTVRYHLLAPLLVAEVQRQERELASLRRRLAILEGKRQFGERVR